MAIKTYQVPPYVDDFAVQDINFNNKTAEEKNFLRILFKPGVSVQVRELNQMQSILQSQIDKIGRSLYKEGPIPQLSTEATLDRSLSYVDININSELITGLVPYLNLVDEIRLDYNPDVSPRVYINAEVLHYQALPETNQFRFFIKYLNSVQDDNGDNVQKFSPLQVVELANVITTELQTQYADGTNFGTVVDTGKAIHAKTRDGVYFAKGHFVYSEEQDIYAKLPAEDYLINAKVVFKVVETIVNYQTDRSLLDNAAGYPNETAPGADRYTIDLQLSILSKDVSANDISFIDGHEKIFGYSELVGDTVSLLEVDDSAVVQVARPEFSGITDVLAERTREESGDYTLDPYVIDITGFYNDTTDDSRCGRGVYSVDQMLDSDVVIPDSDISGVSSGPLAEKSEADRIQFGKSRFVVGVEPSIAYVDGYRIAEPEKINVVGRKARTISPFQQTYSTANLGSYILGTFTGTPSFDVDTVYSITDGSNTPNTLATCRVRSIEKKSGSGPNTIFKVYIYDIQFAGSYTSLTGATTVTSGSFVLSIDDISLYDTQYNRSIYKLPADFIKSVKNQSGEIEFTARKIFNPTSATATEVVIQVTSPDRFEIEDSNSYIVIDALGQIKDCSAEIGGVDNNTVTLTGSGINTGGTVSVIASYRTSLTLKSKTLTTITNEVLSGDNTNVNTNVEIELANHDIIEITSAQDFAGNDIDLTDLVLDNGQRDGCYKKGKVKYIGSGIVASGANTGGLKISYTYFAHGGGDYFSVDSYSVDYPEIPNYKELRLSDSLDFRAKVDGGDFGTYLDPNSTIDAQIQYYLSRIDKLVVTRESVFKLIEGVPAVQPIAPEVPSTAMHLYTLYIPAYTFCHTNITSDFVDNRRYTMRDIGGIETRVQNLEYYTSLSLLEKEAEGKQIFDTAAGNPYDRFKNGIIVDSFAGHLVGYVDDKHYNCSMDPDLQVLRPYFETRSVPFTKSSATNIVINDGLATLSYTEGPAFVSQMSASVSVSVNPYDVATWLGSVKLSPSSDEWLETRRAPDIVNNVGGNLNEMQAEVDRVNKLGTQWNSWQTTWTGTPKTTRTSEFRPQGWGKISPGRRGFAPDGSGRYKDTTWSEVQSRQTREGIKTTASIKTVTHVKDDKVISVSFVPFIRARKVYFKGQLFKPNTKLKVFFDGVDITKYATGVVAGNYKEWSNNASVKTYYNKLHTDSGLVADGIGGDIITNNSGEVYGWFVIPNNSEHQFKTGERKFILTDGKAASDPAATTSAEAVYTATGKVQTKQRTVVNTRTIVKQTQRVSESRLQTTKTAIKTVYHDPLAQSFVIGENPNGVYIHSLDLYFSTVPNKDIPIKMYLVEVENGYPTQRVVPLSEVVKQKSEINTSSDASLETKFTFDSPIFLQFGVEYAIVTESNSAQYRQWLSEVGTTDVNTGEFISKNPYLGVSFKSQNASTWTADQMKDFKMELRRAEYVSQGSIILDSVGIGTDTQAANSDEIEGPLEYSQLLLNTDFVNHSETDVLFEISTNGGSDWNIIIPNENYYISTAPDSPIVSNDKIKIRVTLKTNDTKITPVVDLDRISLITVKNVIGSEDSAELGGSPIDNVSLDSLIQYDTDVSPPVKIDSELAASHGSASAVYMTKEVVLNNPSDRLDAYLNINKPYADSNVLVYARFKRSEDNIEDIDFKRIDPSTPIPINDFNDYSEIQYTRDFSSDSPALPLFTSFQVKIVLVSNDHALVPTVKDFRAIATI